MRRYAALERLMWQGLARWVLRRGPRDGFGYAGPVRPLLWAFVIVSAVETVAVHLILPWPVVRLVVDVLSVYGLLWMLGIVASYRVYPHLVDEAGIRVRHSLFADIAIPGAAVAEVRARRRLLAGSAMLQVEEHAAGRTLSVPVSGQTNVEVVLREPTPLGTPDGPVTEVRLYADDVDAFLTAAQYQWRQAQ
ncbi:PH domain-containing protein [Dactylosporangium sp. McL0621]|uniref:PH domain-containing protein n=1 Tax=Dactylosporangium sp. McL0621 TaxID=3415678 RepID=UPI003CED1FB2